MGLELEMDSKWARSVVKFQSLVLCAQPSLVQRKFYNTSIPFFQTYNCK